MIGFDCSPCDSDCRDDTSMVSFERLSKDTTIISLTIIRDCGFAIFGGSVKQSSDRLSINILGEYPMDKLDTFDYGLVEFTDCECYFKLLYEVTGFTNIDSIETILVDGMFLYDAFGKERPILNFKSKDFDMSVEEFLDEDEK